MHYNFGGVNHYDKLQYFTFRNIELVHLVEKPILGIIINFVVTFFYTNLELWLPKYLLEVLIFYVFLFLCIMGEILHAHKSTQSFDLGCGWP
jgi:hypothetical protein